MKEAPVAIFLLSLCMTGAAAAQDIACDSDNATQAVLNACAADDYARADKQLNAAYGKAMKRMQQADRDAADLGPHYVGAVDALRKGQRGWIAYRDGQCEAAGFAMRGGSAEPMVVNGCMAELSRARAKELDELLSDDG